MPWERKSPGDEWAFCGRQCQKLPTGRVTSKQQDHLGRVHREWHWPFETQRFPSSGWRNMLTVVLAAVSTRWDGQSAAERQVAQSNFNKTLRFDIGRYDFPSDGSIFQARSQDCQNEKAGRSSAPFASPALPSLPLSLEVGPLNPARGSGEHCKLPQRVWDGAPAEVEFGVF